MRKMIFFAAILCGNVAFSAGKSDQTRQNEDTFVRLVEHCKTVKMESMCYLEKVDAEGGSTFLALEETWKSMQIDLNEAEKSGHVAVVVTAQEYAELVSSSDTDRIDYDKPNHSAIVTHSWSCSLAVAGGMGLGGLAGASFGPLALWGGAAAGGMLAAAEFCDVDG